MLNNKNIEDRFTDSEDEFTTIQKMQKRAIVGAGIGTVVGIAGGIYLAENINDYAESLKQAPQAIRYGLDAALAIVGGGVCGSFGGVIAQLPGLYKFFKKF